MYQTYFGFAAAPFSIAPDPRYLYMSQRHQEALATLLYGLHSDGGFVLLTGEVGAGKTTICRCLLEQIPDTCDVAYLFNPKLTVTELLSTICDEFGIAYPAGARSIKRFVDLINQYLLEAHARGRRAVLIIDEAQNLSPQVLEQIRLLTNLETSERKLLQILLLGQPELVEMLARPELRQLAQRIVARYHLLPLDKSEVAAYVQHRLDVAGARAPLFSGRLLRDLHQLSGGVPRVINVLCDRALLGAFVQGKYWVDRATLQQAAREVLPPAPRRVLQVRRSVLAGAALVLAGAAAVSLGQGQWLNDRFAMVQEAVAGLGRAVAVLAPDPAPAANSATSPVPRAPAATLAQAAPGASPAVNTQGALHILGLPPDMTSAQSRQLAFATLFHKWQAVYHDGEDPCVQAAAQGMLCRTARGGLDELRRLNTPVILHMADDAGHPFYALLTGLRPRSAMFSFGAQVREVSLAALAGLWGGEYTVLLRAPQEVSEQAPHGATLAYLSLAAWGGSSGARVVGNDAGGKAAIRARNAKRRAGHVIHP